MKKCRVCKLQKSLGEFTPSKLLKFDYLCKACRRETRKPSRYEKLKARYGLTEKDFNILAAKQSNSCKICFTKTDELVVDHCHTTNRVRGLLCDRCNVGLGCFKEDVISIRRAIDYLELC